ncbi:hypothetical protein TCAL_06416 [Tigriopus californicus]|uniref:RRM domain-containing protein n=1 Tax=Tigriopus californicus TaxID=6832 RepID=A0A553PCP6_TIGCA|nr:probable splicing factor, arginine/serine-rich 7 [Tigriopus californicus]TRY75461.1 hypothetical protein TCAL_06416 [Tigriopus californicus]|eukprot:TCALIF_06416-PA protein Name:"Similar to rsp-7 Probable splicing factor, arginine/serine-rich 7 (Caenorhabditis elegans)" AED:0.23 eAED:0.23 QI:0/-1/0/1/-1/1/1/0/540
MDFGSNRVLQVTNIAPQATRDQMLTLFSHIGRVEEIRLYPTVRDAAVYVQVRCCFLRFADPSSLAVAQHLNNTVFIDRAIILTPIGTDLVPDEHTGLIMAQAGGAKRDNGLGGEVKMPPNVVNRVEGHHIVTYDPRLETLSHLPPYPPLPAHASNQEVETIRRTITLFGLDSSVSAQQCMEVFSAAGEVKFFRFCTRENDAEKYALIEFTDQSSVIPALEMNDQQIGNTTIKVNHALTCISKPTNKSNEAAQREIEEAMTKVKEAQSLVSAAVDPLMGMLSGNGRSSRSRSRSHSRRPRSRSRDRGRSHYSSRRSRSRDRRRSRSRRRTRSKDRKRKTRSKSRDRKSRRRSRSRSKDRKKRSSRSRSKDRKRRDKDKDKSESKRSKSEEKNGESGNGKENGSSRDSKSRVRSRSREKRRSRSKDRKRSRSRDRKRSKRSRSRDRKKRSRSKDRKRSKSRDRKRSKSRDRKRSRSKDRKEKKRSRSRDRKVSQNDGKSSKGLKRDYDQEEAGFESPDTKGRPTKTTEESLETQDMEISNSP